MQAGRSYWAWTAEEWATLIGRDQDGFRKAGPALADAVRPCRAAHAVLLGGFTAFCQPGRLHRRTLAWRVFGRDWVDGEIRRIRPVLAGWGYRPGREDDTLPPMVTRQVFLLNRGQLRTTITAPASCSASCPGRQSCSPASVSCPHTKVTW